MAKVKSAFFCQNCGVQRSRWEGRCSECGEWNSLVEEPIEPSSSAGSRTWSVGKGTGPTVLPLNQTFSEVTTDRWPTGIEELDRVLGGGVVPGAFVLVGGDPGIGKSTLLLQMAGGLTKRDKQVLYVSGEESLAQSALRAKRLGIQTHQVEVACEANMDAILQIIRERSPQAVIIDSIQTLFRPDLTSAAGSVSQVRECASQLMAMAKNSNLPIFLIGHVTKEGSLAGPKTLEHMVDTVLSFEGDPSYSFRLLRCLKNRFGPSHELGVFQMIDTGLKEVHNPSEFFLQERQAESIGSTVFAAVEGSRPLLCEVQALSTPTPMAMPRRTSIGFDLNRVHLLIAVLEKHLQLKLVHRDIFINVVGGLRLTEPAADLAVAAALISSERHKPLQGHCCLFGEIGLTGEIRAVSFCDLRLREATKLGFTQFIVPMANKNTIESLGRETGVHVTFVKQIKDLRDVL